MPAVKKKKNTEKEEEPKVDAPSGMNLEGAGCGSNNTSVLQSGSK